MKSYEEMTQSVMNKAAEVKTVRKKRKQVGAFVAFALCAALLLAGLQWFNPSVAKTDFPNYSPEIQLLSMNADGSNVQKLIEGVQTPLYSVIRVKDVRGMSVTEREQAQLEERQTVREILNVTTADDSVTQFGSNTAIVTIGFDGRLYLTLSNYSQISDMSVTTTESGAATISPQGVISGLGYSSDVEAAKYASGLAIWWSLSNEMVKKIEENPNIELTEIRDTVTVAVDYEDGSTVTVIVDITVDENGQIFVIYQGADMNI